MPKRILPTGACPDPYASHRLRLEDDVGTWYMADSLPLMSFEKRNRTGWNDDGDPVFEWVEVAADVQVLAYGMPRTPAEAGASEAVRVVMLYEGEELSTDLRMVVSWSPSVTRVFFRITSVEQNGLRAVIEAVRIE